METASQPWTHPRVRGGRIVLWIVLCMSWWCVPGALAQPAAPISVVRSPGFAHAILPPSQPGGADYPGGIVGQVCPQDQLTVLMLTRQDETRLWARIQVTARGLTCAANHLQEGRIVFVDMRVFEPGQSLVTPPATQPATPTCDPSYPTVCIPPPPPNLNCDDIPYTNFRVEGDDPHGFDSDDDGIGCET